MKKCGKLQIAQLIGSIIPLYSTTIIVLITFWLLFVKYKTNRIYFYLTSVLTLIISAVVQIVFGHLERYIMSLIMGAFLLIPNFIFIYLQIKAMKNTR